MTVVAAFDFDATLTDRDTVVPFLRRLAGDTGLAVGLAREARNVVPAVARRDRDRLRVIATRQVFAGRRIAEVDAAAAPYGAHIHDTWLRADTTGRLAWHLEQGHRVVIVSASYEQYVRVVAARLGAEAVLATRLEVDAGTCTGRLAGDNCRGPEKVIRLRSWLAAEGLERDEVTLWAYGDSSGDRELLAEADHPHWVRDRLDSVRPVS